MIAEILCKIMKYMEYNSSYLDIMHLEYYIQQESP